MKLPSIKNQKGFTLIELLVVIGILAILLAITLIAINPSKHFEDSRNAQRSSNVAAILNGIYEYESANNGNVPPSVAGVGTTATPISSSSSASTTNASATTFSTPDLTYTVPSGNTIATGSFVSVASCSDSGNDGIFKVTDSTDTTVVVNNTGGSTQGTSTCVITSPGGADLCTDLVPTYLANLPTDPSKTAADCTTGDYDTGYTIAKTSADRFTVTAPDAEGSATISVTR